MLTETRSEGGSLKHEAFRGIETGESQQVVRVHPTPKDWKLRLKNS